MAQERAKTSASAKTSSTPFDALFEKYRRDIPLGYLQALAYGESSLDPNKEHPESHATGLFQITHIALKDFNLRNGKKYTLKQLKDPELNTEVATDHIRRILAKYAKFDSLKTDWASSRWVSLLTQGWNSGHNALSGIVRGLEKIGIPAERITSANVQQAAQAKGVRFLSDPKRAAWASSVASTFANGRAIPVAAVAKVAQVAQSPAAAALTVANAATSSQGKPGNLPKGVAVGLVVLAVGGWLTYRIWRGDSADQQDATLPALATAGATS